MRNLLIKSLFVVVLATGFAVPSAVAQVARTNDVVTLRDGLKEMLQAKGAASLKKLSINVDAENAKILREQGVSASGSYTVYQGVDQDGAIMGTVLIVNERGKEGPLQVMVAVAPDNTVYDVGFTLLGEDKGKPAQNWPFLRQFLDKSTDEVLSQQVNGVSGATWTSESVTNAINRGAALYALFLANN